MGKPIYLLQFVFKNVTYRMTLPRLITRKMGRLFGAILVCLVADLGVNALYFHIGEKEKKCFIEEIPEDTMLTGKYKAQLWDKRTDQFLESTPGMGMHVEVKDPAGKILLSKSYGAEGAFTFTSHTPGEHQICIHSNSTKWSLFAGVCLVDYANEVNA